jgi:hypothetical protein
MKVCMFLTDGADTSDYKGCLDVELGRVCHRVFAVGFGGESTFMSLRDHMYDESMIVDGDDLEKLQEKLDDIRRLTGCQKLEILLPEEDKKHMRWSGNMTFTNENPYLWQQPGGDRNMQLLCKTRVLEGLGPVVVSGIPVRLTRPLVMDVTKGLNFLSVRSGRFAASLKTEDAIEAFVRDEKAVQHVVAEYKRGFSRFCEEFNLPLDPQALKEMDKIAEPRLHMYTPAYVSGPGPDNMASSSRGGYSCRRHTKKRLAPPASATPGCAAAVVVRGPAAVSVSAAPAPDDMRSSSRDKYQCKRFRASGI